MINNLVDTVKYLKTHIMKLQKILLLVCLLTPVFTSKAQTGSDKRNSSTNYIFSHLGKAKRIPAFECKGYWVWGSSVVKGNDNKYHMYVSRWPQEYMFHPGWVAKSEIVHAVSDKPEGPYKFSDIALSARGAQYWDGRSTHNPRVLFHGGKYYLMYMGSTHPFNEPTPEEMTMESKWTIVARSNKRIGLAVSDSPYGPWKRFDKPILETKPRTFYSYLTSNPTPCIQDDGSVILVFKGRRYIDNKYSSMQMGVAYAPSIEGPYTVLNNDKPILDAKGYGEGEDPFLWKDKEGFHIVFKDQRGEYTGEKESGVLAHSKDAIEWTVDKAPQAYSRTLMWEDGKISEQGQMERPFILFEDGKPSYMFFGTSDGVGHFMQMTKSWNMVIPFEFD